MAHGLPDWGLVGPKATVYGLDDLAEHAGRVGSPNVFDRRGDLVWQCDFRDGLESFSDDSGIAGGYTGLSTAHTRCGAYSMFFNTGPAHAAGAEAERNLPFPVHSRLGLEASFSISGDHLYYQADMYAQSWTHTYHATMRVDPVNFLLQYRDQGGVFQPLRTGIDLNMFTECPNTLKFVIDWSTGEYVRAILNHEETSMAGLFFQTIAAGARPILRIEFMYMNQDDYEIRSYVDSVIVTQNEP